MEILRELVQLINRVKLRSIRKLGFPLTDDARLGELYELVANDHEETAIAKALTGRSTQSGDYRRLKSDLIDRLVASLFLVDLSLPSYNSRQRAYFEVHKNWAAAKILLGKNARTAGIQLAEQTYRQARRYEFNDQAFDISRNLRLIFATVVGNQAKYASYATACQELQQIVALENQAEALYAQLISEYYRKKADKSLLIQQAESAYQELAPLLADCDSYNLHLYTGLLRISVHTAAADFARAAVVCDEMIAFFEQKDYTASVPLQIAYYQKMVCHFQLRKFGELSSFVDRGLELLQEGSYNWFKFQETYLLLALHTGQYSVAYAIYQHARDHARFSLLPAEVQEYWRILAAYLQYLAELGEIPAAANDERFTKFRIGRFINQTPLFSKDKRGLNVSILLVQILFLIARNRYEETVDKIDAIEQYCRRHLYREDTLRAFYFIKALLELPKNSFHKTAVERHAARHLERLAQHPLEEAGQANFLTEIIPFEILWEYVVGHLENRFY